METMAKLFILEVYHPCLTYPCLAPDGTERDGTVRFRLGERQAVLFFAGRQPSRW